MYGEGASKLMSELGRTLSADPLTSQRALQRDRQETLNAQTQPIPENLARLSRKIADRGRCSGKSCKFSQQAFLVLLNGGSAFPSRPRRFSPDDGPCPRDE